MGIKVGDKVRHNDDAEGEVLLVIARNDTRLEVQDAEGAWGVCRPWDVELVD